MVEKDAPSARTRVVREAERGVYDRAAVYEILDAGFLCHVGFVVDDLDETVRRIHELGLRLEFNDAPIAWPRSRSAYVKDPDGIMIEFTNRFGGGLD